MISPACRDNGEGGRRGPRLPITQFPLVGRDGILAELRGTLAAAAQGTGGCVVVEGPAGIGKSRVLAATSAEAAELGMAVAAGRATVLDRVAPLTTLLTSLQSSRPPLLESARLTGLDRNRYWLVNRLGELIEDYVRARALVIAVDDVQWADELSALALRVLVPGLSSSPVLWLLARRLVPARSPAQDAVNRILAAGRTRRLRLGPLPDDAVVELCTHVLGVSPDPTVLALAGRSGGNPFLLEELLTSLRDQGHVLTGGGTATVVAGTLPSSFLSAVGQRLRHLSDGSRRLLEAGAVLGRPFTVHEAAGLLGRSVVDLAPAATEAVAAEALVDSGATLAFRHDLIREAVYKGMPSPVRQALHREAAGVVHAAGRSPVEAAEHLVEGGRQSNRRAVTVLHEVVKQVTPTAPGTAADLIMRVLDLLDEGDESRPRLIADAVRLLASAGRLVTATKLGEAALRAGLDAPTEAAVLLGLSEALKHAGQDAAVVERTARALARPGVPAPARAELLAIRAHALLNVGDADEADAAAVAAIEVAEETGEHAAAVFGAVARSVVALARGNLDDAIVRARGAVETADDAGGESRHRHPRLWLARALAAADRFTEADALYEMGQRESDQLGTAWSLPLWHCYRAELWVAAGRLDDAQAEAEGGLSAADQLTAMALSVQLLALLAEVAIRRGEMTLARRYLRRAQHLTSRGVGSRPDDLSWRVALLQDATGQQQAAMETLADLYHAIPERRLLLVHEPGAGPQLVRIAQAAGAGERAEAVAAATSRLAAQNPTVASLAGAAAHAEGLLRGDLEALRTAVRAYRSSPRPLIRAVAIEDTALAADAAGHRGEAVALLEEALAQYLTSGAKFDAARAQRRLDSLGVRRKRARWPPGGAPAASALTQSELRVVRLVAEGMTNREVAARLFLSPHTVDSHLRHVFAKLAISSRVDLTRWVMAHDGATDPEDA